MCRAKSDAHANLDTTDVCEGVEPASVFVVLEIACEIRAKLGVAY